LTLGTAVAAAPARPWRSHRTRSAALLQPSRCRARMTVSATR